MTSRTAEMSDTILTLNSKPKSSKNKKLKLSIQIIHRKNGLKKHVFKFDYI